MLLLLLLHNRRRGRDSSMEVVVIRATKQTQVRRRVRVGRDREGTDSHATKVGTGGGRGEVWPRGRPMLSYLRRRHFRPPRRELL